MARRSQCSSAGDNPLDPNYLPPHYREDYRLAIDALVEEDLEGYYKFLQKADVVDFLSTPEIQYIQSFIRSPHQSYHPEQQFQETEGDGSSDTYWPIHSDQDVPGLDLGWPQLHRFIGPTEVTTLVNPPEPDMPSIKEQARRLIKNAQQVIAIVMDMFTDVDMFADILNAAMRSVAVYILLDEQNTDHFLNMVSNCRVNLQSIQFLRVRTVSGITYHCRSGKSFKGQMMDRFLLTDCRAVLSGNYSFMWSFEKLHRCMAHLFLGQLVSTFDEEFRILFAQSQPLMVENTLAPIEDFAALQKRQNPSERTPLFREPRTFLPLDSEERMRHSYDEQMDVDWRMMSLKRQEPQHSPADVYSRFPSPQPRIDSSHDQGPYRMSMLENPAFKRHSYAEGVQGRYSYPHLQPQGMPEPENQGRQFHRGQQPCQGPVLAPEADYSGYDKFWNQDFQSDQYSASGLPQEMQPPDNFDPVLNYLSSTRYVDFDQSSEKLVPEPDLLSSPHPKRQSMGSYPCQSSPTPSNTTEQKLFLQESNADRKDPTVKQGLRNWRISSYLSTYDNPGEEGLPLAPSQGSEPFEEPSNPLQQTVPGIDLSYPKIPNVREFKIPAVPRVSQIPCYTKNTVREKPKKLPDEPIAVAPEAKTTPTPSESSSTADGEKAEEAEQKEPKTTTLLRDESFRRKFSAMPRGSRLRSSLLFSSLDQQHASQDSKTAGQQDEENDKNEAEQTKLPFVLGQKRSITREPFEWSRYIKSTNFDSSTIETSKPNDENSKEANVDQSKVDNSKDLSNNSTVANSSLSKSQTKSDQPVQAPTSLLTTPSYVDMNDPDNRLMFFKELAAKRKAAKAAEAEMNVDKAQTDVKNSTTLRKDETDTKKALETTANTSQSEGLSEKHLTTTGAGKTSVVSEKKELETSQPIKDLPISAETEPPSHEALKDVKLSKPAVKESCLAHPPTSTNTTPANVPSPEQGLHGCEISKQDSLVKNDAIISQTCKEELTKISSVSEELETNQPTTSLPDVAKTEPLKDLMLPKPAVKENSLTHPMTSTIATPANVPSPEQGSNESQLPKQEGPVKTDSKKVLEISQPTTSLPISAETVPPQPEPIKDLLLSKPAVQESSLTHPLTSTNSTTAYVPSPEQGPSGSQIPKQDSLFKNDDSTSQSCKEEQTKSSTDSEKELEISQPITSLPVAVETEPPQPEPVKYVMLSKPAVKESSFTHPSTSTNATPANVPSPEQSSNESQIPKQDSLFKADSEKELEISQPKTYLPISAEREPPSHETLKDFSKTVVKDNCISPTSTVPNCDSTSKESSSPIPSSLEPLSSASAPLDSHNQKAESAESQTVITEPAQLAEKSNGSELTSSNESIQSIPSLPTSCSAPQSSPKDTLCSNVTTEDSSSVSSILSPSSDKIEALQPVTSSPPENGQTTDKNSKELTESESTQVCLQSDPKLTSSEIPSAVDSAKVESDIAPDTCTTLTEPNIVSLHSTTKTNSSESEVLSSSEDVQSDIKPPDPSLTSPLKSEFPHVSNLETSTNRPDQIETGTIHLPSEHFPSETSSPANLDITANAPQSTANASPQDAQKQATRPSELNLTGFVSPAPVETVPRSSPLTVSGRSVLSSEARKTETNMPASCSPSNTPSLPKQITTDSNETTLSSTETSHPTEPTSKISTEPEPKPEYVTPESHAPEPSDPAETSNKDQQSKIRKEPELSASGDKKSEDTNKEMHITTEQSVISEKTNDQVKANNCLEKAEIVSNQVISASSQSKQPKASQSRYQSSTANVLSSSNLRDDTKLLLEQISANSQSRNEATKESPVTDDEKEDKADKDAKRQAERQIGTFGKGQPKSTEEREKLLERIQSMRKERKVYSRFEMAP
ncbi:hypothetical protein JOB18_044386 [Solea senegalensis]|uniref:Scaffolding anchor of CK1 domain-containing protein n=1 Tax=Solea senegalensis TaxID=28829 RepID=A0AAV6S6U3_SOLSE|nr:protein FAM83H [Solea senegalensis]KAG7512976.1 hypothetical protein JOB18_044386 [Solea senegalensis]